MTAIGSKGSASMTLRDATHEQSTMSISTGLFNAGNFAASAAALAALWSATDAITLGVVAKTQYGNAEVVSNADPSDAAAQRESKLLVQYWDTTTEQVYSVTVPTIDFDMLSFMPNAGDAVAFKVTEGAPQALEDWVTAFEAIAKAPITGNAVAVIGARFVGRNS